jgi:hypothetical protein
MQCRYICGADDLHWLFIGTDSLLHHFLSLARWHPYFTAEFKKAYPNAKVYTVADAAAKMPSDINFDGGEFLIAINTGSTVVSCFHAQYGVAIHPRTSTSLRTRYVLASAPFIYRLIGDPPRLNRCKPPHTFAHANRLQAFPGTFPATRAKKLPTSTPTPRHSSKPTCCSICQRTSR